MKRALWLFLALLSAGASATKENETALRAGLNQCRQEPAPLLRLDCYDGLANPQPLPAASAKMGEAWQRAMAHERQRSEPSTDLRLTVSEGENPRVIMTTPAIGVSPPRPVLMLSCVDNITRLQVALTSPVKKTQGAVRLATQRTDFEASWFVRENGFLLESSRGLLGIEEIKRLFGAQTLTLTFPQGNTKLVFSLNDLERKIVPLRNACHW